MPESSQISDDTRQRIEKKLRAVLDGSEEFHIEEFPGDSRHGFMQCAPGPSEGCLFIEFAEDDEAGVPRQYRACDVAIDEAVPLFVSYAAGNNEWKEAIDWIDITDEANQSYSLVIMGIIGFAIVLLAFTLYFVL